MKSRLTPDRCWKTSSIFFVLRGLNLAFLETMARNALVFAFFPRPLEVCSCSLTMKPSLCPTTNCGPAVA